MPSTYTLTPHHFEQDIVSVFGPDGKLVCKTRDVLTFDDLRVQIKEQHLKGCSFEFRGERYGIDERGTCEYQPKGCFDKEEELLFKLL